jgi:hypothetical protein
MPNELTDDEWAAIKPMLPNKPPGIPRVNDRRVLKETMPGTRLFISWTQPGLLGR